MDATVDHHDVVMGLQQQMGVPFQLYRLQADSLVRLGTDVALDATRPAPGGEAAYRITRFYRAVNGGWLHTQPAPVMWGAEESCRKDSIQASVTLIEML